MLSKVQETAPVNLIDDPEAFASTFLRILDKEKNLVPFRWNKMQKHFHANRTGRDLILKARQLGSTTVIQGELYRRAVTSTRTTMTLAHDADTTAKLRIMADRFWEHHNFEGVQPERKYANASMTTYPEFDSVVTIATAGNVETGRGDTYTDFHGSEVAFWPDAAKIIAGALQGGDPDAVLESTANGAQGYFFELCMEALRGEGVWTLHFYAWWWDEAYKMPLDDGETIEYTEDEQKLVDANDLTPEQIKWRRYKQKELKGSFIQEYPEDPITCFLTSGNSYFGDLSDVFTAPMKPEYNPNHVYVAGLDWGQSSDFTAMPVIDITDKRQVDLLHINKLQWKEQRKRIASELFKWSSTICPKGHIKQGHHEECPECGFKQVTYKVPKLGAEANSIGSVNIEALQDMGITVVPFNTTNATKSEIMSSLYEGIHTDGLKLQDHPTLKGEMYTFVSTQLPSGVWRLAADGDGHDDTVIGLGIAWWVKGVTPEAVDITGMDW
jgi:hypothetical protein